MAQWQAARRWGLAEVKAKRGFRHFGRWTVSGRGGVWDGFTLIELLVVVAVSIVLAGVLLPNLGKAKGLARGIVCRNNLRQWGLGTQLYIAEYDDFLPPEGVPNPGDNSTNKGWYIQLPRELGLPRYHDMPWRTNRAVPVDRSLWICPANSRRSNGRNLFHYCLNEHVNGSGEDNQAVRLGSLNQIAQLVWLFDSKNLPAVGSWSFLHTNLHSGGAQFLFLDGHVKRFRNTAYWDFTADKGRTNNPEIVWIP